MSMRCPQVLSLPKNADSEAILRAYRKKLRDNRGNDAALERIEAAHTALLMRGLSSRLAVRALLLLLYTLGLLRWCSHASAQTLVLQLSQGGAPVAADVKYADRAVYFPWRPRCAGLSASRGETAGCICCPLGACSGSYCTCNSLPCPAGCSGRTGTLSCTLA